MSLRAGDRVFIDSQTHPWGGSSGIIVGRWNGAANLGLDWEVELDGGDYEGHQVACGEDELRPERRAG